MQIVIQNFYTIIVLILNIIYSSKIILGILKDQDDVLYEYSKSIGLTQESNFLNSTKLKFSYFLIVI